MAACAGPKCSLPVYAVDLCRGHYAQWKRREAKGEDASTLRPLRAVGAPALAALSLRVTAETKARASADPDGARAALERWAKRAGPPTPRPR